MEVLQQRFPLLGASEVVILTHLEAGKLPAISFARVQHNTMAGFPARRFST
jgi:hypothetical protein